MATPVEILRSFAVASFPSGALVLNLSTGVFFEAEPAAAGILLALARSAPPAEMDREMAALCKIPAYAARERVRAVQLQLSSPYELASSHGSLVRMLGTVRISAQPGLLRVGEAVLLEGATVRMRDEMYLMTGREVSGRSLLCGALRRRGCRMVEEGTVKLRSKGGRIEQPIAHGWFLETRRSKGMGLMLAACNPGFVAAGLLTHTSSTHSRGAWVEIFRMFVRFADEVPAFRVTLPEGELGVHQAVAGFTQALDHHGSQEDGSRSS